MFASLTQFCKIRGNRKIPSNCGSYFDNREQSCKGSNPHDDIIFYCYFAKKYIYSCYFILKLLKAVQSSHVDSRACVRVGNDVSEWFPVNVGLRQGCVMSPWLFNEYMGGVVREVNLRVLGKLLELLSANGGSLR